MEYAAILNCLKAVSHLCKALTDLASSSLHMYMYFNNKIR